MNGPDVNSASQYYSLYVGLGNDYGATGAGSYGMQLAIPRNVTTPYLAVRYNENNSLAGWQKISAGYADSAGAVAWTNVSGRPTAVSAFTNDSGYITAGANITGMSHFVRFLDNRAVNDQPQGKAGYVLSADFKDNAAAGSPPVTASGLYSHILTTAGWDTNGGSGGWPAQLSIGDGIAVRQATSSTAWGPWRTVLHSNNFSSYALPLSGGTVSGLVNINNLLTQAAVSNNVNGLRNINPGGGTSVTSSSVVNGAIRITLPQNVAPMIRFTVRVYTYDNLSFDIYCGGHTSGGAWYNTFAYMTTQNRSALNVRFTYGGGNVYVYIGDLGSSWSYPQVFITDVQVGYVNYEYDRWDDGWNIAYDASSYNTISATHAVYPPSSSVNNSQSYASIYYDSGDTNYYIDPASTSDSALKIRGGALFGPNTSYGASLYIGSNGRVGTSATVAVTNGNLHIDSQNGYQTYINWYSNENIYTSGNLGVGSGSANHRLHVHGTGLATADFRSPIFYDSDNTGYYVDPASTSNVNVMQAYQYQGNGNVGGTGNASWHPSGIYSAGFNWLYGGINAGGGSVTNMVDARANLFYDYNDTAFYIDPNSTGTAGNFAGTINATDFNSTSDIRYKKDLSVIDDALNKVLSINGYTFTLKETNQRSAGVIAQEVEKVLPEVVHGDETKKTVSYGNMVGLLIEAIKEQQRQIEKLKKLLEK